MKILFISSNLIGDSILSTGILAYILDNYKNPMITIVTGPTAKPLFLNFPNIDKIIIVKKRKYGLHWFKLWSQLIFTKWDLTIDLRSSIISYLIKTKDKKIFKKNKLPYHQVEKLSEFIGSKKIQLPKIYIDIGNLEKSRSIINNKLVMAIAPGGNWNPKIWSSENFNKLIIHFHKKYKNELFFLITGSKKEYDKYFEDVTRGIQKINIINLMGTELALTYGCLSMCKLFIGNDSGLMHLSASTGINTIGLFGPTRDDWYRPYGKNCYVVRTKENVQELRKNLTHFDKSLMSSINVSEVINFIETKKLI